MWAYSPLWAVLISVGPFAVTYNLLLSIDRSRRIEESTIRALGRLPEAAGLCPANHSIDVRTLAHDMGVVHGLGQEDLDGLRRAAALHDIGLLRTASPMVSGTDYSDADKARWAAEIIGSSRALSAEAAVIGQTGAPYRVPGADPDRRVDQRSRIIRVACAYQGLVASGMPSGDAIETLYSQPFAHPQWAVELIRPAERVRATVRVGPIR
jgi:hypothetical protein